MPMGPPYCHPHLPQHQFSLDTLLKPLHNTKDGKKHGFVVRGKKVDSLGNSDQSRSRLNWIPRQKRGY